MTDRRTFLKVAAAASVLPALGACAREEQPDPEPWSDAAVRKPQRSVAAVLKADSYDHRLADTVRRGLELCELDPKGLRVVIKPNFVEYDPGGAINTHPVLIAAAVETFRSLGAASVAVAEGPGHRRDNEYLLRASGLADALRDARAPYVDLNMDASRGLQSASSFSNLGNLYLPDTVTGADLLVSMPKLKVHHWAGVTLSMKNMFGIMPGSVYGWPKNPLHYAGIQQSILDINATIPVRRFNIVDGIVGMEGDGPIRGQARHAGVLVFGADPVAVDATATRVMGLEPARVWYLRQADRFMGNLEYDRIQQRGEDLDSVSTEFEVIEALNYMRPSMVAPPAAGA